MSEESPISTSMQGVTDGRLSGYQLVLNILNKFGDRGIDKLLETTGHRESAHLELKASVQLSNDDKKRGESPSALYWDIAQGIYAISNTSGGILIIGIDNDCNAVQVIDRNVKDLDAFLRMKIEGKILPQQLASEF